MAKHLIKNWKGSRGAYNVLVDNNMTDPWTKYYVIDTDTNNNTTVTEYFGRNQISFQGGDFLAVNDVLVTPPLEINPYDRYLIGTDALGYKIYEYTPIKDSEMLYCNIIDFDWQHAVRILSRGLKCFIYYNGRLRTYDDIDCGEF